LRDGNPEGEAANIHIESVRAIHAIALIGLSIGAHAPRARKSQSSKNKKGEYEIRPQ